MKNSASDNESVDRFLVLFTKHQRKIHAYIGTLLPSRSDADDVMQETSLALWQKWETYDPLRDFSRWASGIARIEVLRHRRKHASSRLFFSEDLIKNIAQEVLEQSDLLEERSQALSECLAQLKGSDCQLIKHRYGTGSTAVQTAKELDRPLSSVYKALARIRRALLACIRRQLAQEFVG